MVQVRSASPAQVFCACAVITAEIYGRNLKGSCRNPKRAAQAELRRLENSGLVRSAIVEAYPTPRLKSPLYFGPPNKEPEDYDHLAYLAEQRWTKSSRPTRVYFATPKLGRHFGSWAGREKLTRPETVSHDLAAAAVWFRYLERHRETALRDWRPERQLQYERRGGAGVGSVPDGLIRSPHRTTAVEILGHYPAEWIRHHVKRFRAQRWHIAIW